MITNQVINPSMLSPKRFRGVAQTLSKERVSESFGRAADEERGRRDTRENEGYP